MAYFRTCPRCGANLDPGEVCDCLPRAEPPVFHVAKDRRGRSGKEADKFSDALGIDRGRGKKIFLDLFLYAHGMAVLTAAGKLTLVRDEEEEMISNFLLAFVEQALRKAQTAMQRLLGDGPQINEESGAR